MLKDYLDMDSKGIFPMKLEDMVRYIRRGKGYISAEMKGELKYIIEQYYTGSSFVEASAPKEAYNYMKELYDCDLSWVPFYKSYKSKSKRLKSVPAKWGGFCYSFPSVGKKGFCPSIVLCTDINVNDIAVHEMIHSARRTMIDLDSFMFEEVMAGECEVMYSQGSLLFNYKHSDSRIKEHPMGAYKSLRDIFLAFSKLKDCFSNKADYALIRLRRQEMKHIAKMGSRDVAEYFKGKADLRFKIMCEKLGL